MSYIESLFADRIGGKFFGKDTKIYKFQKIKLAKAEALKRFPDLELLDFGVGEPDDISPYLIRQTLKEEVEKPENRGYSDNGIRAFKEAASVYMEKVFNVSLDPVLHINHTIGSKSALAMFSALFINEGDVSILTVPGYPVLGTHTRWYGGEVINLALRKENNYLPDFNELSSDVARRAKILLLNYPNNPTGAGATEDFYRDVVLFAKEHNIIVVQDAAYGALVYGREPLSFLSVDGALDVGIEFHSLSKSYNMTGFRLGFVCGNPLIIKAFAHVKDNIDSGQFIPIQKAGIEALRHPEFTEEICHKYERRLKGLISILRARGFSASMPDGTFYLFVEVPKGIRGSIRFSSGEDFSQWLIREKCISTVPWDDTGAFVRFSVTFAAFNIEDERRVLKELSDRLSGVEFEF